MSRKLTIKKQRKKPAFPHPAVVLCPIGSEYGHPDDFNTFIGMFRRRQVSVKIWAQNI